MDSRHLMFNVIGWAVVVSFILTTIITLLALTNFVQLAEGDYLGKLFTALVIEIVAAGFFLFKWGMGQEGNNTDAAEHLYFQNAISLFDQAQSAQREDDLEEADRLLGEILRLSADELPFDIRRVFRLRGDLAFDKQLWLQATNAFGTYYEIEPDDLAASVRYGRALRETNRYADALEVYERAARQSPNNYDVLNGLQNITRRMGGFFQEADRPEVADSYFEKARGYISAMLKIAPDRAAHEKRYLNSILARARLYWQWERYPEAITAFKEAIEEFPDFRQSKEDLAAVMLEEASRKKDASLASEAYVIYRGLFEQVEDEESKVFVGAGMAEAVAMFPHPTEEQIAEAETAALGSLMRLETVQEDPYPFYALAVLLRKKGDAEEAERYLTDAIRHERRRSADPYRFDYVRLVKYEKLFQRWTEFEFH